MSTYGSHSMNYTCYEKSNIRTMELTTVTKQQTSTASQQNYKAVRFTRPNTVQKSTTFHNFPTARTTRKIPKRATLMTPPVLSKTTSCRSLCAEIQRISSATRCSMCDQQPDAQKQIVFTYHDLSTSASDHYSSVQPEACLAYWSQS